MGAPLEDFCASPAKHALKIIHSQRITIIAQIQLKATNSSVGADGVEAIRVWAFAHAHEDILARNAETNCNSYIVFYNRPSETLSF